uniref:Rab-GAP TBC domain-containing protein n=1 Tax=Ciona savignyi TaxID=51511 RepID=H2ZE47_CIOSA
MYVYDHQQPRHYTLPNFTPGAVDIRSSLKVLCDTMRRQIISRAFYGWLAHCRHLTTVRTHLSGMVHPDLMLPDEPTDATMGVNQTTWAELMQDGKLKSRSELMRLTYFGGVAHQLRHVVWAFLLGHYPPDSDVADRAAIDTRTKHQYEL